IRLQVAVSEGHGGNPTNRVLAGERPQVERTRPVEPPALPEGEALAGLLSPGPIELVIGAELQEQIPAVHRRPRVLVAQLRHSAALVVRVPAEPVHATL